MIFIIIGFQEQSFNDAAQLSYHSRICRVLRVDQWHRLAEIIVGCSLIYPSNNQKKAGLPYALIKP